MGLFLLIIIIFITVLVMVRPNTRYKPSGKFKELTKNKFRHEVSSATNFQRPLITIIGPEIENTVSKVVSALLIIDPDKVNAIMVVVNNVQVGYLSEEDTEKFLELLKDHHLSKFTGLEVKALIYGDWGNDHEISNFKVRLNLPKNLEDSEIQ
ncbi:MULTISPECIES: hypothetical protein [Acinetobacter]|jgi:hypothetical protein|uniref:hypothetical protein n=2 Tax=Moraxellaceae TaxID=468 RepID=UPI00140E8024|nr:hypothetical protein [Acinetobacter sp. GFQ9D191M]NHB64316.1 hypothetical protein [Acinetobacter sp. GFQ9D191M]